MRAANAINFQPTGGGKAAITGDFLVTGEEVLCGNKALSAALATITAAVVGVVLNQAVWFALHVLFAQLDEVRWLGMKVDVPLLSSANIPSLVLTPGALIAVFRFKVGMIKVLLASSVTGLVLHLVGGQAG